MDNKMDKNKDDIIYKEYPQIKDKMQNTYGFQQILINKIKYNMYELYSKSNVKNPILSSQIHNIILKLFVDEYYPVQKKHIKTDNKTMDVIMGGYAYNMNIPNKMQKLLYTETDDIDIKIYTTDISNIKKNDKLSKILSIFKYINIIICLYLKQIATIIIEYSRNIFESGEYYKKHTIKNIDKSSKTKLSKKSGLKIGDANRNGEGNSFVFNGGNHLNKSNLIKAKQRRFGVLKSYKIKIRIIKKGQDKDNIDITDLSYEDTYKLIMSKIEDPDVLIKTKISYSLKYINLVIPYSDKSRLTISFSDTKIIYPNIQNPSFFSYYFMNNKNKLGSNLESLVKQNINISDIINTKYYKNSCNYISNKCLQVDIIYMLKFAELLVNEELEKGVVFVPIDSLFKYYKYMIKFIRTHIIKKFFNGTLSNHKTFIDTSKKLIRYIENNLKKKTSQLGETLPINILYKSIINDFHQSFFIKKTMFPEYDALSEIVNDYNNTVYYINRSCALFKKLDDEDKDSGDTIESVSIQMANKQVETDISQGKNIMNGGMNSDMNYDMNGGMSKKTKIILHNNYSFDDIELDNNTNIINSKTHKYSSTDNKFIIDKLHQMLKNEIQFLDKLSKSIKK